MVTKERTDGDGTVPDLPRHRRRRRIALAVAVATVVVGVVLRQLDLYDVSPGGAFVQAYVLPIFLALFAVSAVVALFAPLAGSMAAAFSIALFVPFVFRMVEFRLGLVLVAVVAVQPAAWALAEFERRHRVHDIDLSRRRTLVALGGSLVALVAGTVVGREIWGRLWGPTHPSSELAELDDSPVDWIWTGAVGPTEFDVRARPRDAFTEATLLVSTNEDLSDAREVPFADVFDRVTDFRVTGLEPATRHHYAVRLDGVVDRVRAGTVRTFPDGRAPIRLVFGACARIGSNGAVFDAIRAEEADAYVCIGDFHYGDIFVDDVDDYRQVLDVQLTRTAQSALYRSTPIAYVWDDHDYGPNDSNRDSAGRPAAMLAYREYVPHYDLAGPDSAIYQAFSVGRVRVLLSDCRSSRDPQSAPDTVEKSMLGFEQRAWLLDELTESAATHDLVIWVSTVPWVADAREGADHWGGYSAERTLIADHVVEQGIDNLMMICGDAHMVAIDDGTHTDYSSSPGTGFPLAHAAPLDRPGGTKGGPFTHGPVTGGGQYVVVDATPDDGRLVVDLVAKNWADEELLTHTFTVDLT